MRPTVWTARFRVLLSRNNIGCSSFVDIDGYCLSTICGRWITTLPRDSQCERLVTVHAGFWIGDRGFQHAPILDLHHDLDRLRCWLRLLHRLGFGDCFGLTLHCWLRFRRTSLLFFAIRLDD